MAILETVTFTNDGGADVALDGFVTDGGYTFSAHPDLKVSTADYAFKDSVEKGFAKLSDLNPGSADYKVSIDGIIREDDNFTFAAAIVRASGTTGDSGYGAEIDPNENYIRLVSYSSGASKPLGSSYSLAGGTYDLTTATTGSPVTVPIAVEAVGDQISAYLDGSLIIGPITDSTYTATGNPAFAIRESAVSIRADNMVVESVSSGPSITSVTDSVGSTADQITENANATIQLDQDATVASAELQNSAGTRTASLPIQSSTSNSVTVQGARGQLRYGDTDNKVVLTLGDSSTIEATGITFAAPALTTWANGTSADTTSENSLTQGMGSVPSDYQIAFTDSGTGDPINPVINSDTTVASVENPGSGVAELYDNTDGTWGTEAAYELALDTTATPIIASMKFGVRNSVRKSATMAVYDSVSKGMQ